jgi:hypothetical protein
MLYSKNNNYPNTLPFRIRLPDGSTRTDPTTFTEEIISLAGYIAVEDPPTSIQSNEQLVWTGTEWKINIIETETQDLTLPTLE